MNETLFLATVFLLLIGAMGVYFYSRVAYSDRKMNYLESILIDLRLKIDMQKTQAPMPVLPPEPLETSDSEEVTDEKEFYASVIDTAASTEAASASEVVEDATNVVPVASVDYDSMTRDEVAAIAEKKSLRVTKRMQKAALVNMLRESDKNSSVMSETGKDGVAGSSAPLSMEASSSGAPISMAGSNDSLSA
jgi:hypothetical protein